MAAIAILRELWQRRLLVLLGVWIALAVQLLTMYRVEFDLPPKLESRQYDVGIASAAVLIDSQSSQVVDLGGGAVKTDVATLAARSKLLANLLATRPLRDEIAQRAGVPVDRLIPKLSSTTDETPQPGSDTTGVRVKLTDRNANVLSLQTSETVPIISINGQAPQEGTARRLADATVVTLRSYLASVAAVNRVPDVRQLVMRPLGGATSTTEARGPSNGRAALVFVILLALWCAAVLGLSALQRAWRQAAAEEELGLDREPEAPARTPALLVGEGPEHELRLAPPPQPPSRVA